jgi:hypothetical protein
VGFVVDKMALGQVFSEYFGFPCQSPFHQLLHNHPSSIIWGLYNRPEVAAVPSGLSPTPLIIIIIIIIYVLYLTSETIIVTVLEAVTRERLKTQYPVKTYRLL